MNSGVKYFSLLSLIAVLILSNFLICPLRLQKDSFRALAEESTIEEGFSPETDNSAALIEEQRALEEELRKLEEQISKYEEDITKTQQEKKTLQNQIYLLKQKIEKSNLQIQQSNVVIRDINFQIDDTKVSIEKTSLKVEDSREMLANILRTIYEEEQESLIEILLLEPNLSAFFDNLMALESLNLKNQEFLESIKALKLTLENQKQSLDEEKTDLERLITIQTLQKKESENLKKDQEYFLKLTDTQYQKYLKEKEEAEKRAAEIRARIFELIGIPEAPTFGEAYELAKYVEKVTGVRPAFLLAVLTQESNIGKNVGQCYLKNSQTGAGMRIISGEEVKNVMKPSRDVQPFLQIAQELGRDPYNTPVSCPIPSVGGYGGAMGPAQFIPSTWMLYKDKVKAITAKAPDPWNIKDAFLAAALYLADYGAAKKTSDAEWKAAMIYFSGTTNKKYRFYGDSVLSIATRYEEDIEAIEEGGLTQS